MALALKDPPTPAPGEAIPRPTLAELFASNVRFVWRVLASHGVQDADVEDATQEVFLAAHRRMDDWNPAVASARTWLYAIAIRVAANHRKRAHVVRERVGHGGGLDADPPSSAPEPDQAVERGRLMARVERAIAALDPAKREVFSLFELEELSMKEVAEAIGCPLQTAYARLYAARRELAEAIGTHHEGEQP
jgi:RNA polymerase sigma-70 factor (ECF subfamily)